MPIAPRREFPTGKSLDPSAFPAFSIIAREKDTVRLGDCEAKTGCLKSEVMVRAIATLGRFLDIAKTFNAEQIIAVATSAVREAPNGRDFLKQVAEELDLNVSLISGQEEARRIYLGVLSGMEFNNESQVIIDIGGGSNEWILGDSSEPRCLTSTKIGAVRLTGQFVKTDPISREEFAYLQAYIRISLERPFDELRSQFYAGERLRLIGTAGTIETLAAINARERLAIPGMSDKRAEIILAGSLILQEAMTLLGIESLTVCDRSLREGVIVDWMLAHGLIENRLRYQGSIRQRSIMH